MTAGVGLTRIFLSHSSLDTRAARALEQWLAETIPRLKGEIFLDVDATVGILPGERWKDKLRQASLSCEAVICLLSRNWDASHECRAEYRAAELLDKQIFVARLEPSGADGFTSEWQRCDLYGSDTIDVPVPGEDAVPFARRGLAQLESGIGQAGFDPQSFHWPPAGDQGRSPYRGWEPFEEVDAAVFFGRDAAIIRALEQIRGTIHSGREALFVVLGPSGTGKSSFLRAGLLPRLRRDTHRFVLLDVIRPQPDAFEGDNGFVRSLTNGLSTWNVTEAEKSDIRAACLNGDKVAIANWLNSIRTAAADSRVMDADDRAPRPAVVLAIDQSEELFGEQATRHAEEFLNLLRGVMKLMNQDGIGFMVVVTIRMTGTRSCRPMPWSPTSAPSSSTSSNPCRTTSSPKSSRVRRQAPLGRADGSSLNLSWWHNYSKTPRTRVVTHCPRCPLRCSGCTTTSSRLTKGRPTVPRRP